jgi:hypothetical protein
MKFSFSHLMVPALLLGCLTLAACSPSDPPDSQTQGQAITEAYSAKLTNARPYPLGAMNDSAERANLTERLLRMNNPYKIGYVYELTQNGQVLQHFTIKGKVSSTGSQLTNTQNIVNMCSGYCPVAVDSMGDDGSYGPEEGGDNGIFFFTTGGVLVEYNGLWLYSDAALELTSAPLLVMSEDAKPTSTAGVLGTPPAPPPAAPRQ